MADGAIRKKITVCISDISHRVVREGIKRLGSRCLSQHSHTVDCCWLMMPRTLFRRPLESWSVHILHTVFLTQRGHSNIFFILVINNGNCLEHNNQWLVLVIKNVCSSYKRLRYFQIFYIQSNILTITSKLYFKVYACHLSEKNANTAW